jgi:hypothetical protein
MNNFDRSLFKNYQITEKLKVQFRAESFNALNHGQFAGPATGVTNTPFGTSTGEKGHGQRQWTFGLKLMFQVNLRADVSVATTCHHPR